MSAAKRDFSTHPIVSSGHIGPRAVTVRAADVGQSFACVGQVVDGSGAVVAETELYPYGSDSAAIEGARRIVAVDPYLRLA